MGEGRYPLDRGEFPACTATVLHGTGAIAFHLGTVQAGGVAADTILVGIIIMANGTAVTATIAGFLDEGAAARSIVLTGSTTESRMYPLGSINAAALTVTASVADKVVVLTRPA